MLKKISTLLVRFERSAAVVCAAAVTVLILLNVVTRAINYALFWVDEAAIYAMVWMLFFSISVLLKRREVVAVTILPDISSPVIKRLIARVVDYIVLIFSVFLVYFSWIWFQPLTLIEAGFDTSEFSAKTMSFIYQERTNTLGVNKYWIWLIIPYFSISCLIHSLTNIFSRLPATKAE